MGEEVTIREGNPLDNRLITQQRPGTDPLPSLAVRPQL